MGKAQLAPIKTMTIPRLELTAATVSLRLGEVLKKEFDDKPDVIQYHTIQRQYCVTSETTTDVDVANRVQTVRSLSYPRQWLYVDTKDNQADDASRGLNAQTLVERSR